MSDQTLTNQTVPVVSESVSSDNRTICLFFMEEDSRIIEFRASVANMGFNDYLVAAGYENPLRYQIEQIRSVYPYCEECINRISGIKQERLYDAFQKEIVYTSMCWNMSGIFNAKDLFEGFDAIICDECHYFYADSDFNGLGTYVLLQAIALAGMTKTMIFMSATMQEVESLIDQTITNCQLVSERRVDTSDYVCEMWATYGSDRSRFLAKALVPMNHELQFFYPIHAMARGVYGKAGLYINEFSRRKTGDMYLVESLFYGLAIGDSADVVYHQMEWIGKEPEELSRGQSEFSETRLNELKSRLLMVKGFSNQELQEFKKKLVNDFQSDLFTDISTKNGTLSLEKLKAMCRRCSLTLKVTQDKNRHNTYSIFESTE